MCHPVRVYVNRFLVIISIHFAISLACAVILGIKRESQMLSAFSSFNMRNLIFIAILFCFYEAQARSPIKFLCCQANEVADYYYNGCPPQSCSTIVNIYHCPLKRLQSQPTCICASGHCRDACGFCIPNEQRNKTCTKLQQVFCRENERLVGCLADDKHRTCENIGRDLTQGPNELCRPLMCDCISGRWRNRDGDCVEERDCSKKSKKNPDAACPQINQRRITKEDKKTIKVPRCSGKSKKYDPREYRNHCICAEGTFYSKGKRCVEQSQCNDPSLCMNPCQKPHQTYTCVNEFNKRTCYNKFVLRKPLDPGCVMGCDCVEGYRSENGVCIREAKCNKTLALNSEQ